MRILVLEDDPLLLLDLVMMVEDAGHAVHGCATLDDARDCLREPFDFAFLDIDVGGRKSYDVAIRLKSQSIPFAFVSGATRADLPAALADCRFIMKPYQRAAILGCLPRQLAATA